MHDSYDPNREIKKAAEAVILARWDLIWALVDRTEQEHIVSKVIYMKFLARCGEKELQKRKLQLRNAGLEMKMEYMKERLRRNEAIDPGEIRRKIQATTEQAEADIRLMEMLWKKSMRQYRVEKRLTDVRKMNKDLYLDIVMKTSPEVYPGIERKRRQMFAGGDRAYKSGDALTLRRIRNACESLLISYPDGSLAEMKEERMRLEERTRETRAWTALIRRLPPFTYEKLVEDEALIRAYNEESEQQIQDMQQSIIAKQATVAKLQRKDRLRRS